MLPPSSQHFLLPGVQAASRQEVVTCPSPDKMRTRARCRHLEHWVDCYRDSCCPGYTLVVGTCIPESEDPCRWLVDFLASIDCLSSKYGLCEQQCSVYFGRVICTCYTGYIFNKVIVPAEFAES